MKAKLIAAFLFAANVVSLHAADWPQWRGPTRDGQFTTYYFASQEHLDLFKTNPEKYKPQFGAWCAYAVSLGRTAPIDINTFSIVDGRLVIQHNQRAVSGWNKDVNGNLKLADKYWPKVTANGGKQIKTAESNGLLIWIISGAVVILFLSWLGIRNRQRSRRTKMQTTTRDYTSMATSKNVKHYSGYI